MNKFQKSQVLVLVLVLPLVITPILPSTLRPTYLYFILNLIIIALGAEAGLLSLFSMPTEDRKQSAYVTFKPVIPIEAFSEEKEASTTTTTTCVIEASEHVKKEVKAVENSAPLPLRVLSVITKVPSLFFIGGDAESTDDEEEEEEVEAEEETNGGEKGQELFAKAEAFIGNFYKQLKVQREESNWIHQN